MAWGHSSAGRALQWHCRGQRFDPAWLHHNLREEMVDSPTTNSLKGHLLLARPQMHDDIFSRSIIFICSHDADGAVGIIVNRPLESITFLELLNQFHIKSPPHFHDRPIFFGGPVDVNRGFILHPVAQMLESSVAVSDDIALTASLNFFRELLGDAENQRLIVALGYAGWGGGQLEKELKRGTWVHVKATPKILFDTPHEQKWQEAYKILGIDPFYLSPRTGSA